MEMLLRMIEVNEAGFLPSDEAKRAKTVFDSDESSA